MQFKSKKSNPLLISSLVHAFLVGGVFCLMTLHLGQTQKIDIEVYEQPVVAEKNIPFSEPKEARPIVVARKVFGVSKNAVTDDSSGISEKAGNTIATLQDDRKLTDEDRDLPIPTDEYLVDSMPVLKDEVRVQYPAEAKAKNIEGPVVMDILIDRDGVVRQVTVVSGPGFGLNEAASLAISQFRFVPAKVKTGSVAAKIRYTYRFVLQK